MNAPPFQSRRAKGITPFVLPSGNTEDGLYVTSAMPDLMPSTYRHRRHQGERGFQENSWGSIEFLPESNRRHLEEVLASARSFREAHRGRTGFLTDFHYLPEVPDPLWTRHLPCPELPGFERAPVALGDSMVEGGFSFMDTHSFWILYGQHLLNWGLTFLCLRTHQFNASPEFQQAVRDFALNHELCLVDWGHLCIVPVDSSQKLEEWFTSSV